MPDDNAFAPLDGEALDGLRALVRAYCGVWTTETGEPDWTGARRFYHAAEPSVRYFDPLPPLAGYRGYDDLVAGLRRNVYAGLAALRWTPGDVEAWRLGEGFAVTAFDWTIATRARDGAEAGMRGRMSIVWQRHPEEPGWRIVHEHSSAPFAAADAPR